MDSPTHGWPTHEEVGADMIGERIDGRFQIIRRLARGGMADVFLSKDPTRKCHVAIKLLRSRNPESQRRFAVEAEVLSNVQDPGIVRAIAFGKTPDGQSYMALEYLAGESLSQRLARGPLPWREVAEYGIQVASALHTLHTAGIIHRDVKPGNIMLTAGAARSFAKLIDLGLASVGAPFQAAQDAHFTPDLPVRHPTQLGHPIGTPAYLPPEAGQCAAEPRLDVFSLGVTLYQLCTGQLPAASGPRPMGEVCPASGAPEDLSRLLLAALEPDPTERLPSADHLRRGLEAILAAHPRTQGPRHLFGGSFDRLEVLGVGASAVVFRASDRWLSREVAVKVLRDAQPSEDDAIRFRRAAKVLSALRHANIPRILHFGVHEGQSFAVTELCAGAPATGFARPDRHLRPEEVIAVGLQLAGALGAVHAAGIVYRDLHPGNVLIARGEPLRAWIFDFDQAQVSPGFYAALTERWATPPEERTEPRSEKPLQNMDYAAPEVRAGAAFSAASDVYALGLLLYRLLTGKRPFPAAGGEPTPPRGLCPACSRSLEGLLLAMLSPDPDQRPALEMVQATLEDEQAELAADEADVAGATAIEPPTPVADRPASANATSAGPASDAAPDVAPPGGVLASTRSRRILLAGLGLTLTAAASLVLARATVLSPSEQAMDEPAAARLRGHGQAAPSIAQAPVPTILAEQVAPTVAPVGEVASPVDREQDAPARTSGSPTRSEQIHTHVTRRRTSAPPPPTLRREPATSDEAQRVMEREPVIVALRACDNIPGILIAELDIARGRGSVMRLNRHAPSGAVSWHGCARAVLEDLAYPVSESSGLVRVRLTLE